MAIIAKKVKTKTGVNFVFQDAKGTQLSLDVAGLSADVIMELAIHGASQKVGDSYSGIKNVTEAIASSRSVIDNLLKGIFNASGGSGSPLLAEALARIKGFTVEDTVAQLALCSEEALDKLHANARIKNMISVIKGERAQLKFKALGEDDDGLESFGQ